VSLTQCALLMGNVCICPDEAQSPDRKDLTFSDAGDQAKGAGAASEETEPLTAIRRPLGDKEIKTLTLGSLGYTAPSEKFGTSAFNLADELAAAKASAAKTPEEMEAARLAFSARKDSRRQKRQDRFNSGESLESARSQRLNPGLFLSGLPEVESDIAYRCNLIVIGSAASGIVKAACESHSARSLPGGAALALANQCNQQTQGFRCLCRVEGKGEKDDPPLAKLAFHLLESGANDAQIAGQLEVASTVIVYALTLDERCDAGYLEMQLWEVAKVIEHAGLLTGARRKMSRAALICTEGEGVSDLSGACSLLLKDFEKKNGRMWMFDLVQLSDANALHNLFQRIASRRTLLGSTEEDCGLPEDGSNQPEADMPAFMVPLDINIPRRRGPGSATSKSSIATTNGGPPPIFEAENEGSECSEGAMELHRRAFSLGA